MNMSFPTVLVLHKDQKNRTHKKADDYRQRLKEICIDGVFQKEAKKGSRQHANNEGKPKIETSFFSLKKGYGRMKEFLPVKNHNGQDSAQLNHYIEHLRKLCLWKPDEISY